MVDVSDKKASFRQARAEGIVRMRPDTLKALLNNKLPKGAVLTAAKLAGIQAAKKTAGLIPLCHQLNLSWVDLEFEAGTDQILIRSIAKTRETTGVEMEALTAVAVAALTIYDMCKAVDKSMTISNVHLIEKTGGKSQHRTEYRPPVGIITLSDSVARGDYEDRSGPILAEGFTKAGCSVRHQIVLPDGSDELVPTLRQWMAEGVELILTTGGTGLGPRDLTIPMIEPLLDYRLRGVEQALHAYGQNKIPTAMLSRLAVGVSDGKIIVCLPGSTGAVKDALNVLIPEIFHAFHMLRGESH
ncbi:MAG: bifunctional molybdenum cofactor biosynthesis protein MoaC/MoaB [FCB group bacterium]|nr:bifunctional molybdenum cofactor biosynthesis protein MoaC/MoaB [FCB group bacterium]